MNNTSMGWMPVLGFTTVLLVGCASPRTVSRTSLSTWALNATPLDRTFAELDNDMHVHLAWAKTYRARILEVEGPRTVANTLVPYNEMMMHIDAAAADCGLFARVHPDSRVRRIAEKGEQAVAGYLDELRLDRELYEAFGALDVSGADAATQYVVHKTLRDFRRAGVDKPQEARTRIAELNREILVLGQEFSRNIREDDREIVLASPADLDGMPQDWIDRHQPGEDGKIHVTTRHADYMPFMTYARSSEARSRLYREFKNRGYPKNIDVLHKLLTKRHELAQILGYANWAEYVTEDKMVKTPANVQSFIDRIAQISREPATRDYAVLLRRKRQDAPAAMKVEDWERNYYTQLVKSERYGFDPESLRPYFNFPDVLSGMFELTRKMFGITYRRVHGLNLWHQSVTAWDVYDGKKRIGRFYLDLHLRKNKYAGTAQFDYRTGIAGVRLPQAVLVGNLPNPADSKDGLALMEHEDVATLFQEFGNVLHTIFAGHRRWMGNAGTAAEWDFMEVPSRIFEEWCYNAETLQSFAKHHRAREPIPAELVEKLRRTSDFGIGLYTTQQVFYAAVSLDYHSRDPKDLNTTKRMRALQEKYSPFDYIDDTYFQCGFAHLDRYSAAYYTYMWSLVIAKDLFSKFDKEGILNTRTARRYRRMILEPGGSKKAADLVSDFLGRPYSFDAFEIWLNRT